MQLHLFRTAKNGGYGSGNQAGIDYAVQYLEPDYIMIANHRCAGKRYLYPVLKMP